MTNRPNEHILSYLEQFLEREPAFALMISGEWGTGKTFLVKSFFRTRPDHLYVSVNGATKSSEIVERLYLSAFPVLADKTMRALGSIARTIAGSFRIKSDLRPEDLLDLNKYKTLIFDDLERSLMKPEELLGFINNFVEHDSKHVVLIAHEGELSKRENYNEIREKVIGFSLDVKPDFEAALAGHRSSFSASYAAFLERVHKNLVETVSEARWRNVRVAKYVLNEFSDVFDEISSAEIGYDDSVAMFRTFFVLDYAYKTGIISREDISKRNTDDFALAFLRGRDGYEPSALDRLDEAHPSVDVFSSNFDNEYLEAKICDGFHDSEKLSRTLGDISGRTNSQQNPEWRNLWYLIHQSDDVIDESFARMMTKFNNRQYDDAGVILHVFGLLYRMREAKILPWKAGRITRECKKFILDKFNDRSLPILGGDYITDFRHGAAHGLGFTAMGESGYQEAVAFYRSKSNELTTYLLLEELNRILNASAFDLDGFRAIILQGARDDNVYSKPFLYMINAAQFAESVMKEAAGQQFLILSALGSRYEQSPYPDVRTTEAPWLRKVIKSLRRITKNLSKTAKFRIEEIIKWNLAEPARSAEEGSTNTPSGA